MTQSKHDEVTRSQSDDSLCLCICLSVCLSVCVYCWKTDKHTTVIHQHTVSVCSSSSSSSVISGSILVMRGLFISGVCVCQPILEHQIRPSAPSSVISRPTCFSSSPRCCWQVGSAPFVRRRCDCLASSAPFTNIQTYLLTYLLVSVFNSDTVGWVTGRTSGRNTTDGKLHGKHWRS